MWVLAPAAAVVEAGPPTIGLGNVNLTIAIGIAVVVLFMLGVDFGADSAFSQMVLRKYAQSTFCSSYLHTWRAFAVIAAIVAMILVVLVKASLYDSTDGRASADLAPDGVGGVGERGRLQDAKARFSEVVRRAREHARERRRTRRWRR